MTFERKVVPLRGDTPGQVTEFTYYVIGPRDAPEKVHLQAALHADEHPGTMLLHHLLPQLRHADEQNLLRARFTVMPLVNPLGMANFSFRHHLGRYDPNTGVNHNRRWPDLFAQIRTQLAGRLSEDERFNVNLIRKAVAQWIDAQQPRTVAEQLRLLVLREAHDAEFVLDLHCDNDSLLHIFTSPELMPELQDLADWMGAAATLTAADSRRWLVRRSAAAALSQGGARQSGQARADGQRDGDARISRHRPMCSTISAPTMHGGSGGSCASAI